MKKSVYRFASTFSLFLALFFYPSLSLSAIYHVDATNGNDSKSGLSEASAWETIAKVNASSFKPGDQVLFKRGQTWREQLTVRSSGSAGHPITFGTYGTGVNPIINGSDVYGGSWTSEVGGTNLIPNPEAFGSWTAEYATVSSNMSGITDPGLGTGADAIVSDTDGANEHRVYTSFTGAAATAYTVSVFAKHGAHNWVFLSMFFFTGSWEYIGTEWCFFDLSTGTIGNKSGEVSGSFNLVGSNGFRRIGYTVTSPALTVNVMQSIDAAEGDNDYYFMGDGSTKDVYLWGAKVEAASSATQYGTAYYGTSVTTEPQGVWQSNVSLVKCSTKSQLFPGSFWFDSVNSRVYVKATDLTSPSGYAMELGARDYAVYVSSINYVTIKNMVERAE